MISRSTDVRGALRSRQRGFLLNPFRFGGGGGGSDPDYASVSLLLHGDGANGGRTFIDSGPSARVVTAAGSAQTSTAQVKFGSAAMAFYTGGVAGSVFTANNAAFDFGSGNFTIEFWLYLTANTTPAIICQKAAATGIYPFQVWINSSGKLGFRGFNSAGSGLLFDVTGGTTLSTGAWMFCQARRSGTNFDVTLNGTVDGSVTGISGALLSNADPVHIGDYGGGSSFPVRGFIDDYRITKGVVRSATPPTSAFPNS